MDLAPHAARREIGPIVALCCLAFLALVWRFDFLCDDAYISFRYALHLSDGTGLRYNPGESPPVEGFTNLLWVLLLSVCERVGIGSELGSRLTSVACGVLLLVLLGRRLARASAGDRRVVLGALLFPATFAPLAAWSTGGLETMPFTLCAFLVFDGLLPAQGRPRIALAVVAGVAVLLLRADGFVWLAMILGVGVLEARLRRSPEQLRAVVRVGSILALALALHLAWRWFTFGTLSPNTARIKLALGWSSLERGGRYLANFLLSFPSALLLILATAWTLTRARCRAAVPAGLIVAGNLAYVVLVGGDFMAMGRFLVPSVPFLTLLLGLVLERLLRPPAPRPLLAAPLVTVLVALSVLSAFDLRLVPRPILEALDFRWSSEVFRTEVEKWRVMKERAKSWAVQGRMLARIARPGDSLIIGTIGAVGYYSGLVIHDPMGLVNRERLETDPDAPRRSAGHDRRVPLQVFLAQRPTFLDARFVPSSEPLLMMPKFLREDAQLQRHARPEWIEPTPEDDAPPGIVLRVIRYQP